MVQTQAPTSQKQPSGQATRLSSVAAAVTRARKHTARFGINREPPLTAIPGFWVRTPAKHPPAHGETQLERTAHKPKEGTTYLWTESRSVTAICSYRTPSGSDNGQAAPR